MGRKHNHVRHFQSYLPSQVCCSCFSGKTPNVMYETGIAHTLGKVVIPITQNISDIPSDMGHHRALCYLHNREGLTDLTNKLAAKLRSVGA